MRGILDPAGRPSRPRGTAPTACSVSRRRLRWCPGSVRLSFCRADTKKKYSSDIKALIPHDHLSEDELLQRQRAATTIDERDRWFALRTLTRQPEYSRALLADQLGRAKSWLSRIVRLYNDHGPEAIEDRRKGRAGQPPALNAAHRALLDERLQSAPDDGGEWTGHKVSEWIEAQTGRRVDTTTARLYLHRLGYSRQKGRPVHPKAASEEEQLEQQKKFGHWSKSGNSSTRTNESNSGVRTRRGTARKVSLAKPG